MSANDLQKMRILYKARRSKEESDMRAQVGAREKSMLLGKVQKDLLEDRNKDKIQKTTTMHHSMSKIKIEKKIAEEKPTEKEILQNARKLVEIQKAEFERYKLKKLQELKLAKETPALEYGLQKQISRGVDSRGSSPGLTETTKRFFSSTGSPQQKPAPRTPAFYIPSQSPPQRTLGNPSPSKQTLPFSAVQRPGHLLQSTSPKAPQLPMHSRISLERQPVLAGGRIRHPTSGMMPLKDSARLSQMDEANLSAIATKDPRTQFDSDADRSLLTEYRLMNDIKSTSDVGDDTPGRKYAS